MGDEKKEYFHVFLPLMPPASRNLRHEIRRLGEVSVTTKEGLHFYICLLGRTDHVDAIAVSYRAEHERHTSPWVAKAFDISFAALVLVHNPKIDVLHAGHGFINFGCYSDLELPIEIPALVEYFEPDNNSGSGATMALLLISKSGPCREAVGAFSEAVRPTIPKHYRFLSLMRALAGCGKTPIRRVRYATN